MLNYIFWKRNTIDKKLSSSKNTAKISTISKIEDINIYWVITQEIIIFNEMMKKGKKELYINNINNNVKIINEIKAKKLFKKIVLWQLNYNLNIIDYFNITFIILINKLIIFLIIKLKSFNNIFVIFTICIKL